MPARKGQGQWALGYREPLNPNERAKRDDDGLNVRQRIIDIYQHTGFARHRPGRSARPDAAGTGCTPSAHRAYPAVAPRSSSRRTSRTSTS